MNKPGPFDDRPPAEHIAWAKRRALELLAKGEMAAAVASMWSDLGKHPQTRPPTGWAAIGLLYANDDNAEGVRRWISEYPEKFIKPKVRQ